MVTQKKSILGTTILNIKEKYLSYILGLLDVILNHDYENDRESIVFSYKINKSFPDELLSDLRIYTGTDFYYGYLWQIAEPPEEVGFRFYHDSCLYVANVPYLVLHHAPSGYSWGYNGSGPSDLGLNIGEYFARKHFSDLIQKTVWKGQKVSLLAFISRYEIRNYINSMVPVREKEVISIPFERIESDVLMILNKFHSLAQERDQSIFISF
jgi:hypothetical protein